MLPFYLRDFQGKRCSAGWRGVMAGGKGKHVFSQETQGSLNDIKWYPIFLGRIKECKGNMW